MSTLVVSTPHICLLRCLGRTLESRAAGSISTLIAAAVPIVGLMQECGIVPDGPIPVWNDNESAVNMCSDASSLKRSAYILRRIHFVIELVKSGQFLVKHCSGKKMPADALTKHLPAHVQWAFYFYMGLRAPG